jgi:hypothetical protein
MTIWDYLYILLIFPWDHPLLTMIALGIPCFMFTIINFWRKKDTITQALLMARSALEGYKNGEDVGRGGEAALAKIEEVLRGL